MKKKKLPKIRTLMNKADRLFSLFIRHKYMVNGIIYCYTCNKKMLLKEAQNGHYMSRRHLATRYHVDNCRPQCYGCNVCGYGKKEEFAIKLECEYGYGVLQELHTQAMKVIPNSREFLNGILAIYGEVK